MGADASAPQPLCFPLFSGYGIELEYIIVDADTLSVRPIADRCLAALAGAEGATDVARDGLGWSNEFVKHVIELKNRLPQMLATLPDAFQREIGAVNALLSTHGAMLMPTAMHPWMQPASETALWDVGDTAIYDAYRRLFDCRTHGWANLQSMHINLPFASEDDFVRLHAAVRLVLPILPALAASSPIADGIDSGYADYRMEVYRGNADAFPYIAGTVIPEAVSGRDDHHTRVLAPMFEAIAAHDPQGILRREWLNSRGAIPRFDRNAIEIRVVDMQECPLADLAIAAATTAVVKRLCEASPQPFAHAASREREAALPPAHNDLVALFLACIRDGEATVIRHAHYLSLFGFPGTQCTAQQMWRHLVDEVADDIPALFHPALESILSHGTLATRIRRGLHGSTSPVALREVYAQLCACLRDGRQFLP